MKTILMIGVLLGAFCSKSVLSVSIGKCKVLDLTQSLSDDNPYFPSYGPFETDPSKSRASKLFNGPYMAWNFYCTYEHVGTHMDAPTHFDQDGVPVDEVPFDNLIGEACVIDVSRKASTTPDYLLTVKDIEEWEAVNGKISEECIVLLNTGQSRYWPDMATYFGSRDISNIRTFKFPVFSVYEYEASAKQPITSAYSEASAELLVYSRNVKAIGLDSVSLDSAADKEFPVHVIALVHGGIVGYENLANLDKLPPRGATFFGAPIKLKDGTGAQVRAFAIGWNGPNDPCSIKSLSAAEPIPTSAAQLTKTSAARLSTTSSAQPIMTSEGKPIIITRAVFPIIAYCLLISFGIILLVINVCLRRRSHVVNRRTGEVTNI